MLTELVRNPRPYFAERVKYPRLRWQALIVVIAGMVAHAWKLAQFEALGASSEYIADVLIILWVAGIIELLAVWIILTGIMTFIANAFGGDPSFGRLLRVTGYGFIPVIIAGAIWSAGQYLALSGAATPEPPLRNGFRYSYERYTEYVGQASGDIVLLAAVAVGSIFVLAAGYLWYQGVSAASDIEDRQAGIAAGLAAAIYIGYVYATVI